MGKVYEACNGIYYIPWTWINQSTECKLWKKATALDGSEFEPSLFELTPWATYIVNMWSFVMLMRNSTCVT